MKTKAETSQLPIACSLDAGALQDRLARLAGLGATSLLGSEGAAGEHVLRFHDDPETRAALDEAVAVEAECCPFLALNVERSDGVLTLSIGAPEGGEAIADQFVAAIRGEVGESSGERRDAARFPLLGIGAGALALLCCLAGPLVLGAAAGSLVGGALEAVAVALVTAAVILLVRWRKRRSGNCC